MSRFGVGVGLFVELNSFAGASPGRQWCTSCREWRDSFDLSERYEEAFKRLSIGHKPLSAGHRVDNIQTKPASGNLTQSQQCDPIMRSRNPLAKLECWQLRKKSTSFSLAQNALDPITAKPMKTNAVNQPNGQQAIIAMSNAINYPPHRISK